MEQVNSRWGLALLGLLWAGPLGAQVSYTPQPIDFGPVQIGKASLVLRSTLKNTSPDTLKFCGAMPAGCLGGSRMTGSSAFRYITDNCTTRPPGTTCVLQYQFLPTQVGPLTGANVIQTTKGPFPLNLVGVGLDTVTRPPPQPSGGVAAITATPIAFAIPVGAALPIEAVPLDSLGQPLGTPIAWTSSDPTVAVVRLPYVTVTQGASAEALKVGGATLTATAGGRTATIGITVLPVDTAVSVMVAGFHVRNLANLRPFTFQAFPLWSGRYLVNLLGLASDTVARASCTVVVPRP